MADLPRLTASVEWREILHGHLVAGATFVRPRVHLNLPQLRAEDRDKVEVQDRGWQQALESIYPLKLNLVEIRDGGIVYIDVDPERSDFNLKVAVEQASLPSINELLRAYGRLDMAAGTFSVYSEVKVRNGRIDGYVKPLFKDVKVYDPRQDKKKPVLKKIYEKIVGGLSHILENHPREQVATVADLSGSLEDPNTSAWEIVVRLVSNAFVKAILPGFDREYEGASKGG